VRLSGPESGAIAEAMTGRHLVPRQATLCTFSAADTSPIDQGLALWFKAPASFTGQDVLELHGHGGAAVLNLLMARCLELGARLADPGEFTRRAFLNNKIDLAQAESVADLIEAASSEGALSAARSLVGEFSTRIHVIVEALVRLRMHVEACIDFPEEEIDAADRLAIEAQRSAIAVQLDRLLAAAGQGAVLRDGLTVVLIGRPNVGKSSLLNRLAGEELAIVTPIPGTTRDQVRATITLRGVPIHLIDTAGLRKTDDEVERLGIERTWRAVEQAGAALLLTEAGEGLGLSEAEILNRLPSSLPMAWVHNKIDLHGWRPEVRQEGSQASFRVSALTGEGLDALRDWLLQTAGWRPPEEGVFMARARHLTAITDAQAHVRAAAERPNQFELMAEELRLAQGALGLITGEFGADDLLGEIFSRFCIGK
jgi:tRNA modification GTPase